MRLIVSCLYGIPDKGSLSLRYVEIYREELPKNQDEFVALMGVAEKCLMDLPDWQWGKPMGVGYSVLGEK